MLYFIHISRFSLVFIFFYSLFTKLRDFTSFEDTIKNFQLLPPRLHRTAAISLIFGEVVIVTTALFGGHWLFLSYSIAIVLLVLFTYALNFALKRNIDTSCNCFGPTPKSISYYDIWRNVILICITSVGLTTAFLNGALYSISFIDLAQSLILALVVTLLILNLHEILELVR